MEYEIQTLTETVQRPDGLTVILTEEIPIFTGKSGAHRLNRYYGASHTELVKALAGAGGKLPGEVSVKTTVTECGTVVSLYRDFTAADVTFRTAESWLDGFPLTLRALGISRKSAVKECVSQAEALSRSGYVTMYRDFAEKIKARLDVNDFYIQDGKAVVFLRPGIASPPRTGILKFTLPVTLSQISTPCESADA